MQQYFFIYICPMVLNKDTAQKTAELLLQVDAIKLAPQEPFTWASGWKSPIYCDNRVVLSYPPIRNYVRENLSKQLEELFGRPDAIVGVATGAIGIGMLVADYLNLPFAYVRPEAKKHGKQNQIEGHLPPNSHVVVIEDLVSTGKSSLNAVRALKNEGATVKGMLAIFSYGFEIAEQNFKNEDVTLYTLSDYQHLLQQAQKSSYIKSSEMKTLSEWREQPEKWGVE